MGKLKEFYHEEICRMQEGETFDDEYFAEKLNNLEETEEKEIQLHVESLEQFEEDMNNSGIPSWMSIYF